jgi:hypothetical protein
MVRRTLLAGGLAILTALSTSGCSLLALQTPAPPSRLELTARSELPYEEVGGSDGAAPSWSEDATAAATGLSDDAVAPSGESPAPNAGGSLALGDERGGYVIEYARHAMELRKRGTALHFTGRCESACTLYLSLPHDQTCIAPGASFRFHAPVAATKSASQIAESYMLSVYPDWVKSWINSKGGLSRHLITMDYEYASQYISACRSLAKRESQSPTG